MASGFSYTPGDHDSTWTTAGSNGDSSLEFRVPVYNIGSGKPYSTQVIKTASREGSDEPVSKQLISPERSIGVLYSLIFTLFLHLQSTGYESRTLPPGSYLEAPQRPFSYTAEQTDGRRSLPRHFERLVGAIRYKLLTSFCNSSLE